MEENKKNTDRDVKPTRGQESNENWDDNNDQQASGTSAGGSRRTDEETNTSGAGSSQRSSEGNVGPLDSDLEQLPSEKRKDSGGNATGPGLG